MNDATIFKHVVQKNETLVGIALKYDMRIDELKKLNRLFAGNAFEGQAIQALSHIKLINLQTLLVKAKKDVEHISKPSQSLKPTDPASPAIAIHSPEGNNLTQAPSDLESALLANLPPTSPSAVPPKQLGVPDTMISTTFPCYTIFMLTKLEKLSTSAPNKSFLDEMIGSSTTPSLANRAVGTPTPKHIRSEVWSILGITTSNEVVTCYAKYIPVHGLQITGVLTIAPTRIIFEPNLDDPEVTKHGPLAHQFSVETDRLLEVESFSDDAMFRERLAKQLEEQAPWDAHEIKKHYYEPKPDKAKKSKRSEKLPNTPTSPIHFNSTSEEMLQIVCRGRYRPKNYANFILPKDKANNICQRMTFFLSGAKEERLKACLNLDVCTPPRARSKLRRQQSFSAIRSTDKGYADILDDLQGKRKLKQAGEGPAPPPPPPLQSITQQQDQDSTKDARKDKELPKYKKDKSKTAPTTQHVEATDQKLEETKKTKKTKGAKKKAAKESVEKQRGSFKRWRARGTLKDSFTPNTTEPPPKSPLPAPPASPLSPPPTSPSTLAVVADFEVVSASPDSDISDISDISGISSTPASAPDSDELSDSDFVVVSSSPSSDDDETDLPVMRDESLIFTEKHMHQLRRYLPGFNQWLDWKLLYCTQAHGISFSTFLHRIKNYSPTLFVVEDSNGSVFGGFATAPWAINSGYFGTGQSFLFSLKPKLHVYEWTRSNSYFMLMTSNSIAMGGDKDGRHGFWIDSNFEHGVSEICDTYFNRCLASTERFKCTIVEVWTFTDRNSSSSP